MELNCNKIDQYVMFKNGAQIGNEVALVLADTAEKRLSTRECNEL